LFFRDRFGVEHSALVNPENLRTTFELALAKMGPPASDVGECMVIRLVGRKEGIILTRSEVEKWLRASEVHFQMGSERNAPGVSTSDGTSLVAGV
jgi:hypothetical protein